MVKLITWWSITWLLMLLWLLIVTVIVFLLIVWPLWNNNDDDVHHKLHDYLYFITFIKSIMIYIYSYKNFCYYCY